MRLLIVLPGALGDVIRALPLLGRLRAGLRDAHLGWAVEPLSAPLLRGHPWLDEVHVFARRDGVRAVAPFVRELRAGRYDVALDLGRGVKSAFFAWASGARERLGFDRADAREASWLFATRRLPPQGTAVAKLEQFLAFADVLGLPPRPIGFGLAPTEAETAAAQAQLDGLPRPIVAACVGSSCASRRWEPDRTAAVLTRLVARGGSGVLLGAAADVDFAGAVTATTHAPVRDLAGRTDLRGLMAVLAQVDVAFGPDSGALHLAAALGKRVVSLWGPTSAWRSTPWGSDLLTVQGEAPCAPCFLRECPIGRVCMRSIGVDAVAARLDEALAA